MIVSLKTDLICKQSAKMTHNDDMLYFILAGIVYSQFSLFLTGAFHFSAKLFIY